MKISSKPSNALRIIIGAGALALVGGAVYGQVRLPRNLPIPAPTRPAPERPERPQRPTPAPTTETPPQTRTPRVHPTPAARPPANAVRPANQAGTMPDQDQGILNEMHRNNVGRVVFTRTDMTVGAINSSALVNDFELGQPIYYRVYMERTAVNTMLAQPGINPNRAEVASRIRYKARWTIGGQTIDTTFIFFGEISERNTYTTWRGQMLSRQPGQEASGFPGWEVFREMLSKAEMRGLIAPGGTYPIKVEIIPMYAPDVGGQGEPSGALVIGPTVATGAFNLRIPVGAINRNDPAICVPAGPSDANIERTAFYQMQQSWRNTDATPIAARMGRSGWEVNRNEFGIPIDREIDVVSVARGAEGCYSTRYQWSEPFAGNGFSTQSGSLSLYSPVRVYFPCSCLGR